jgi:chromosome segregation ATPase
MDTMEKTTTQDKIQQLRRAKSNVLRFRKSLIGGYQHDEVQAYIHELSTSLERSQQAFEEKLEEYASECSMLIQEREKLQQELARSGAKVETLMDKVTALTEANAALEGAAAQDEDELGRLGAAHRALRDEHEKALASLEKLKALAAEQSPDGVRRREEVERENVALKAALENAVRELEDVTQGASSRAQHHAQAYAQLEQAHAQLGAEHEALARDARAQAERIELLQAECARQRAVIDAQGVSKRQAAMDANMRLYQYRLGVESDIKGAEESVRALAKSLAAMRESALHTCDIAKIDPDAD